VYSVDELIKKSLLQALRHDAQDRERYLALGSLRCARTRKEHVCHNARARSKAHRTKSSRVCSQIIIIVTLFGKAKCKLCGDSVRLALKHLKDKHPEIYEGEVKRMRMPQIMDKYFVV
jgi:hypothetical protein